MPKAYTGASRHGYEEPERAPLAASWISPVRMRSAGYYPMVAQRLRPDAVEQIQQALALDAALPGSLGANFGFAPPVRVCPALPGDGLRRAATLISKPIQYRTSYGVRHVVLECPGVGRDLV